MRQHTQDKPGLGPMTVGTPAAPRPCPRAPSSLCTDCLHPGRERVATCPQGKAQLSPSQLLGPWCAASGASLQAQPRTHLRLLTHQRWGGGQVGWTGTAVTVCSILCYHLTPPNRPSPPGSQPCLPPFLLLDQVPSPKQTSGESSPCSSGMGTTCPQRHLGSLGRTAARQYTLVFTGINWKNIL